MEQLGRILLLAGAVLVILGLLLTFGERLPFRPGRLPLDFRIERDHFTFYLPLGTSLLLSIIISLILMWLRR